MPLLAVGWPTAKPGQHGTPEPGRSNHPLIFATLPGRAGALYRMPPPLPNRFVGGYAGSAPTAGSRGKTQGTRKACCFASTLFGVTLNFTSKRIPRLCGSYNLRVHPPGFLRLSERKDSRFHCRSGLFLNGQSLASQKRLPKRESNYRLSAAHLGSSFFLASGWCCDPDTQRSPSTRHDTRQKQS